MAFDLAFYFHVVDLGQFYVCQGFEEGLLADKLFHIFDLEHNVFKRFQTCFLFDTVANGHSSFENEKVSEVKKVVPDSAGHVEAKNVGVNCHHPFKKEYAAA